MDSPSDTHSPSKMSQTYSFGDWRIPSPGSYTVLGPSQSGKSELLIKLLKNPSVWREKPSIVIYAAPTLEDRKDYLLRMKEACLKADGEKSEFMAMSQVPDEERVKQLINFREVPVILILDDLLSFPDKHHIKKAAQLGIKGCHHSKITLFMCLQNPFPQGYPEMVTLSRNTTGKFIMYQTNDLRSIRNISSSMFPDGKNFLLYCLFKAKQKLHCRYIFTNNHSRSDVDRRYLVYTCLFPSERPGKEPYHFDLDYYKKDMEAAKQEVSSMSHSPPSSPSPQKKKRREEESEPNKLDDTPSTSSFLPDDDASSPFPLPRQ
jgi:hypothetical protein